MIGLITELQRTGPLSLSKFMHRRSRSTGVPDELRLAAAVGLIILYR